MLEVRQRLGYVAREPIPIHWIYLHLLPGAFQSPLKYCAVSLCPLIVIVDADVEDDEEKDKDGDEEDEESGSGAADPQSSMTLGTVTMLNTSSFKS